LSFKDWLMKLARELVTPCRFVDEVRRQEICAWYGSSRVVALCSRYDNFPFVGLEAMSAGRPVVCTTATGTAAIVEGTGAGAVVPVDDAASLAAALRRTSSIRWRPVVRATRPIPSSDATARPR
jgi:glycosyltransferase involved in cell wall biosynthesis